ncbi:MULTISPECIES: TetR/AcrR family transcriptional regulator [Pseudonocardia]|uniref:Bacterial regulatory protein n=2 Tax=Pseudonocardia TaxID=1847 RepID=A0A1Y2MVQ7_PSEAH|nr:MULTISPECIES: TetR/AcrR family transcriptional regulator [Pseudonocardia]OSY39265.1 Bacterial regulatory protein [Pseudonocardia autotrophica]TDN76513.1 TetR family transcriptional regulator [Pseudonocardia autotrophica]BBG00513.1 TetR family transcriptional regulator [Pseudonocardia autotrophica]GEC26473.1 TetR family transcriptional regulator [Pseudonocardia saturnea]
MSSTDDSADPGAGGPPGTGHRNRPRRRGERLDAEILRATLDELAETGYAALSIERVAARAGAGKASVYRRWPDRAHLVLDAARSVMPEPERPPDTGSLRGDLLAMLRSVAAALDGPAGPALRGLLGELLTGPEQVEALQTLSRRSGRRLVAEVVRRAHERGELDMSGITDRMLDVAPTMLRFHFLVHGAPVPDEVVTGIVDEVALPLLAPGPR